MSDSVVEQNMRVVGQFSQQAEGYRQLTSSMPTDRSAALRAQLATDHDDLLLEICCGPGLLALDFAPHVRHATGLDLTPAMLEQARAQQRQLGIENVEWVQGDAYRIPFDEDHFSIIVCSAAFHHLVEPQRVFDEMVRVCRPGGRIVVRDVTPAADKSQSYDVIEKMRDSSHAHALTREELRALGSAETVQLLSLDTHLTANLPLDGVLATSFPEECSRDHIRTLLLQDALSGQDRFGFRAALTDGELLVSYPISTVIWRKVDCDPRRREKQQGAS